MASGSSGFKSINDARKRGVTSASRRSPRRLTDAQRREFAANAANSPF